MKAIKRILYCACMLSTLVFSACTSTPEPVKPKTVILRTPFDIEATKARLVPGKNTITGSAFLRLTNGNVKMASGSEVILFPATDFADERMSYIYGNTWRGYLPAYETSVKFDNNPQEYYSLQKYTIADAYGTFKFVNLADGEYYILTKITWSVYDPSHRNAQGNIQSSYTEGGEVMLKVAVSGGETKEVVLTQ